MEISLFEKFECTVVYYSTKNKWLKRKKKITVRQFLLRIFWKSDLNNNKLFLNDTA